MKVEPSFESAGFLKALLNDSLGAMFIGMILSAMWAYFDGVINPISHRSVTEVFWGSQMLKFSSIFGAQWKIILALESWCVHRFSSIQRCWLITVPRSHSYGACPQEEEDLKISMDNARLLDAVQIGLLASYLYYIMVTNFSNLFIVGKVTGSLCVCLVDAPLFLLQCAYSC